MAGIIGYLIVMALLLAPVVLLALDIMFCVQKREVPLFELAAFLTGSIYTMLALVVWELPDYRTPLNGYDTARKPSPSPASMPSGEAPMTSWNIHTTERPHPAYTPASQNTSLKGGNFFLLNFRMK